jgi:uncharacterized protein
MAHGAHLLDANALLALGWPTHEHHQRTHEWPARHATAGWHTCALTQAAFVRISCQPAFSAVLIELAEAWEALARNLAHPSHSLLPLDFAFDDVLGTCTGGLIGHRQITDAYLLVTAVRAGAKLLTFDSGIRHLLASDEERSRHLLVLA